MDGRPVQIGEREFLVPKLRVGTWERVTQLLGEIDGLDVKSGKAEDLRRWYDAHVDATLEILRRGYPALTADELKDLIDMDAVVSTFEAAMRAAGRKVDDKGEAVSP